MFDTMTVTKTTGALCGSFLIFLLAEWAAGGLYNTAPASHGGEEVAQAYTIDTGDGGGAATDTAAAEPDVPTLMAAADAAKGEKVFAKCKACHHVDGKNATGPHLDGVVNRPVGSIADFSGYSDGMKTHGGDWSEENLFHFLANPKSYLPGTKMTFAGLKSPEDRANVIAYLAAQGG